MSEKVNAAIKSEESGNGVTKNYLQAIEREKSVKSEEPEDGVTKILSFFAHAEIICSPIVGFSIGQANESLGWIIFLSGIISGFILLGFSKIIQYLKETVRYLRKIETYLRKIENE